VARIGVKAPQSLRLYFRQLQTRHFVVLALDSLNQGCEAAQWLSRSRRIFACVSQHVFIRGKLQSNRRFPGHDCNSRGSRRLRARGADAGVPTLFQSEKLRIILKAAADPVAALSWPATQLSAR
jgi:hypothetical protein